MMCYSINRLQVSLLLFGLIEFAARCSGADSAPAVERPHGIERRIPWTTSRIIGTPEPPSPYRIERAFAKLTFSNAVDFSLIPGTGRLLVAELGGKIFSFPNDPTCEKPDLFVDLKKEIPVMESFYGVTFHPKFEENRYVYLCYVLKYDLKDGSRVSRFTVTKTDPPQLELSSEKILITWLSGGHNGGCLKFGPDGYLYISTGDGAGPNPPDPLKTGQDNSDLLSAILRIDVDRADEGRNYRVPSDNPFASLAGIRPEVWAYGFRNPWRMSFDKKSGDLWAGDVGWELWELVFRIQRAGNYGWSIVEGEQSIHPDWPRGPTPILPPVKAHPHSEAASITGGNFYYGKRLKDLVGAYVYGDWVTGKIWALRSEGNKLTSLQELVDTPLQIICFGEDASGEIYVVDYTTGIYRLVPNPAASAPDNFPRRLSETGLFESVRRHEPAPGVIPFRINAEMWADHATAERLAALPGATRIQTGATNVWLYQSKNEWRYPTNAVLAKTLSLEMERGRRESSRRIETQILHYDGLDWHAYSYRWNDDQTDASLVPASGDEQVLSVKDSAAPGGQRNQSWRFHARTECLRCHNPWVNYALAFTAPQLNQELTYRSNRVVSVQQPAASPATAPADGAAAKDNQLRALSHIGFFDQPLDERARPKFTDPEANVPSADLTERARSWLHVNCAHCHREGAGGSVVSHFDYDTKLAEMKTIGRSPSQGAFSLTGAHVVTPGDPYSSVLYYRIMTGGQGHMPLIGPRFVDAAGTKVIHDWITQLPKDLSEDKTSDAAAERLRKEIADALQRMGSTALDQHAEMDRLLASPNGALALVSVTAQHAYPAASRRVEALAEKAMGHPFYQVRDLFDRFLPEDKRPKKLGASIKPGEILALKGNAIRGQKIFFQEGASQCQQCHRINAQGRDFGPDLSHVGTKYDRAQILENILVPSKVIDPLFATYQLDTQSELSYSGFLLRRTEVEVVLKDANAQEIRIAAREVKSLKPQPISAMPELLLQSMTAQDAADLIEFLATLK